MISIQCKEVHKEKGWDETRQPCKQVREEKVGMNLLQYTRIFPRWFARMFKRKNLWTSLDKNDIFGQEKSYMRFSEGILTMYLYKNTSLSMFLYAALYTMYHAGMLQDRFLNWFLDRNVTVSQERSVIRFQRRSTTVCPGSNVLNNGIYEDVEFLEIKKYVENEGKIAFFQHSPSFSKYEAP